jgi:hypothetical protein
MRQTLFILALLVQMLFVPQHAWSQSNYPIYVSPTLLPPYSLKLSDYSAYGSQRMMVTIVVNDLEVANLPVKLRVKMETAGVTIENPITINSTPIYIDGGSATILFGEDLTDYFNINNLQFKGYSKEAYRRSGQMPEGFYRFSVEVLHFHTNRVISNTGSVTAWIALGKPPVLRTPTNDVELGQYMGVPLTFSWLASNVGSPVSAGSIRYKFEMWEVRVKGVNPYTIVSSIPVFHEYATSSTSYSFNPASVMMEEGLTYAWRVTAFDESGLVPFEQNGQSEVRTFTYKSRCEEVQAVTAAASGQKGTFIWTPEKNHSSYNVEVRNSAADWFLANETFDSKVEFYELERGQTYELRVQAVCNGDANSVSDYSSWTALTITKAQPKDNNDECPDCECSNDLPDVTLTNFELRHNLAPGDTLSNKTGTTRFIVKDAAYQGNGIYKGVFYFWAEIWGVKTPCDFWDLQVNTDNVIVNMDYKSINDPIFLLNIDALVETGNIFLDQVAVVITSYEIVDTIQVIQNFDYIVVQNGQLIAVVLDENGEPVETALNITAEEAEKVLITNEHGDEVVITSKGEVMGVKEYQATGGNSRLMQNYKEEKERNELSAGTMVNFAPHATQKYGFDRYTEQKSALQHLYPVLHNGYRPAFKSVESFRYDKVGVDLTNGLSFRDEMGVPSVAMDGGVSVQGTQAGNNRAFYAYRALNDSTEELVGKLNVLSFDNAPKRVHIIPVNNAKIPTQSELQATLNRIYRQAVATWTVVPETGITMEFPGGRMTHDGAGGLSTYNNDQKAIVDAYVASGRQMERDDLYLFFVEGATFKDRSLAGYMPLQRQVGFIYDYPTLETVAHELGHGAFNLRHTFSPKAFIAPEGQTPNLMDYAGGVELWQEQWGMVHNPERILFGWAQSEEEGAMSRAVFSPLPSSREIVSIEGTPDIKKFFVDNDNVCKPDLNKEWLLLRQGNMGSFLCKLPKATLIQDFDASCVKITNQINITEQLKQSKPNDELFQRLLEKYPSDCYDGFNCIQLTIELEGDVGIVKHKSHADKAIVVSRNALRNLYVEPVTDVGFTPNVDNSGLKIDYEILFLTDPENLKIEVFKQDGGDVLFKHEISINRNNCKGIYVWNGVMNQGNYANEKIAKTQTPFIVKVSYKDEIPYEKRNLTIDIYKEDWETYNSTFRIKGMDYMWYADFVASCKTNGYFTDSIAKPMEWLMNKGVLNTSASFCGQTVTGVLPELAEMINLADSILRKKNPVLHARLTSEEKYWLGPNTGVSMRLTSDKKPSLHSFGASVDFRPTYNPYITSKYAVVAKYIEHLTGFDVLKGPKTASKSYNAGKLFLEKLHGKEWVYVGNEHRKVIEDYEKLNSYKGYSIDSLSNIANESVYISNYGDRRYELLGHIELSRRRIVFEEDAIEGLNLLIEHLTEVSGDTIASLSDTQVEHFFKDYRGFKEKFGNLEALAVSLNADFETVSKNRILQHGFCDIEPEVYDAFNAAHKIITKRLLNKELEVDAGIVYNGSIDAMHFGLCKELVQYLTNNP